MRQGQAHRLLFLAAASLVVAGCLPSSQRQNSRELATGDSLSRAAAAGIVPDSLEFVSVIDAPEASPMELPTSMVWLPDSLGGFIMVVDTRRSSIHRAHVQSGYVDEWRPEGLAYPYVAGVRRDTLVLLNRGRNTLDFVVAGKVRRSLTLPEPNISAALATSGALFAKRTDEDATRVLRISEEGEVEATLPLNGPQWRHVGFLRAWGDSLLSLSGFRPVADVWRMDATEGSQADSLALLGFDSPQLERSSQFMRGEVDEPPLLISSGVVFEDELFVLNLRADGIRIDVYDHSGRIQRILAYSDVQSLPNAFPADLAIRRQGNDQWFALAMQNPGGMFSNPAGYLLLLKFARPSA